MIAIYTILGIIAFVGLAAIVASFFIPKYKTAIRYIGANIMGSAFFLILIAYIYFNLANLFFGT